MSWLGLLRSVNKHVAVSEWGQRVVFLRTLREGGASKSYGIQCARLAGMPDAVVKRSQGLLKELESWRARTDGPQLNLFQAPEEPESAPSAPVIEALSALNPDELSPREAHEALYRLKDLCT
jgi:DNA mismatch repair protein MutS